MSVLRKSVASAAVDSTPAHSFTQEEWILNAAGFLNSATWQERAKKIDKYTLLYDYKREGQIFGFKYALYACIKPSVNKIEYKVVTRIELKTQF